MQLDVMRHALRNYRRATWWWIAGIFLFNGINAASYPAIKGQAEYDKLLADLPDALLAVFGIDPTLSLTSPAGFLVGQVFGLVLPMLFVGLGVAVGSQAVAGEEEKQTLDLLLAQPIRRRRVVLEKLTAVFLVVTLVGIATWAGLVVVCRLVGLDASLAALAAATTADVLLGWQSGALALALGAWLGRRAPAAGIAAAVAVGGLVLESLAEFVKVLERFRWLSPFHFVNGNVPMVNGLRLLDVAVLLGLAAVAAAAGTATFSRRDIGV